MSNLADILFELEREQEELERVRKLADRQAGMRNEAIREALGAGVKQADIARITGLSRARIAQLR